MKTVAFKGRNLSIKYRLVGVLSVLVLLSTTVASFVIYSTVSEMVENNIVAELSSTTDSIKTMVQASAEVSIRNRLRAIAEKNIDVLTSLENDVHEGRRTREDAMDLGKQILLSQTIGKTGYIYCIRPDATVVVHPAVGMVGRNISSEWLAKTQAEQRVGYLEYDWANPGEVKERKKALYMMYFAPWDWIVSVSTYREEFRSLVDIDDFRDSIESYVVGDSGYAFIIDTKGEVIHHPWLGGNVLDGLDATGQSLFREMVEKREGKRYYSWRDPYKNEVRQKLMFFRYIPELEWVVASASYLDEVHAPLVKLRYILLAMGLLSFALILPIAYYIGGRLARPVTKLAASMSKAGMGDSSVRAPVEGEGELAELATHFNEYMDRLDEYRAGLESEIDERIKAEEQLQLFAMVFENALEGISITDNHANIIAINPAFTTITGYTESEVIGKNPRVLKSDRHDSEFYRDMWLSLKETGAWHGEIWNRRKTGESYPEILSISSIRNAKGEVVNYVAVFHDISDMKLKDEQIEHQAYHDALTGLPNRTLAQDRLGVAIAHARREDTRIVVLSLDMDNFKKINDSLGHSQGDRLIQEVGKRLLERFRDADTVARLGGDEFLILLEHVDDERKAVELAERALGAFVDPFYVEGRELTVTTSVGVTMYPDDGTDAGTLMKNADMAMFQSKATGKDSYFLFTREMNDRITKRLEMENDMRRALIDGEFTAYFQPKVHIDTGAVVSMEALVRWHKADGTVVSPMDFIPLAEETGLIVPLGEFVLETACKALQVFDGIGYPNMKIAVNLSPVQFGQENLVEMIMENLERNGVPTDRLELEITESTLIMDMEASVAKLHELVELGLSIAIDDFGTGHSSLYYLKKLPIDVLKIDRSFIRDLPEDESDAQIVKTIVLMAHSLGISTVAEGVETIEQLEMMKSFECDLVQGYYYSRPLPLEDVIVYFQRNGSKGESSA